MAAYIFIKFFTAEQNNFMETNQEQNDFMGTDQEQNDFTGTDQEENVTVSAKTGLVRTW